MSESYLLCEGYQDRAFWAGLLLHLGCSDPGSRPGGKRATFADPWGLAVRGGEYAYYSRSGHFIRVVPAMGKDQIAPLTKNRLKQRTQKTIRRLVINVDSDHNADGTPSLASPLTRGTLETLVRSFDPTAVVNADGDLEMDSAATKVSLVPWESPDPVSPGIPNQHTMERLICAAIMSAYPPRGPAVQTWLDSRPEAPVAGPKEYAWSYLAGWHADTGSYDGFCTRLWKDPQIVAQLEPRLKACGAWRVAESLASE